MKHEKEIAIAKVADAYGLEVDKFTELLELMGCADKQERSILNCVTVGILTGMKIGTQTSTMQ